jgi:HK97 family phage major capsid protein
MKKHVLIGGLGISMHGIAALGARTFGCIFHKEPDDRAGAKWSESDLEDMSEGKFRSILMGEASKASTQIEDIKKQVDNTIGGWAKENRSVAEEFTLLKNQTGEIEKLVPAFQKFMDARQREYHMATASLSPVRRIQADPVKRAAFNLLVRQACFRGDAGAAAAIEAIKKDLDTANTPGSTLINTGLLPEIYDTLGTFGIWNTLGVRRLSTKTTNMPVKTVRALATWLDEATAIDPDATKAGSTTPIAVKKAGVLLLVSRELLQDAEFDVTADVLDDFAEAIAYRLDHSFFVADGTADSTDGGFTGVFEAGTAATAADGNVTVESLDMEDFIRCLTVVDPVVLSRMSKWWMHPTTIARALAVKDGNGRPIFLTALEAPTYGGIGSILGYPVVPGHALPSTNAASAKVAAFGDPNGYVVGIRQDIELASSSEYSFNTDEVAFRGIARAAGKIRRAQAFGILTLPAA